MLTVTLFAIILLLAGYLLFLFSRIKKITRKIKAQRSGAGKHASSSGLLKELDKQAEEFSNERKQEAERLEKLENYRREFLGNVSHELKTPIFNIQGYIHTLLDGGLEDKKISEDYLKKAVRSVDRMIAIVEDLQTITQLEKGELELEQEEFDLVALCRDVVEAQELKAREHQITLMLLNTSSEPVKVYGDKFRIRQALVNLVVNSVRYGKPGGETKIKVSDAGEKVMVEVADNGIGISKEHLPRIFERFYRADKSRSRELGGTGLGLSIVKHIMEAHNQTIEVMSTEGAGSVFSFTLKKA